MVRGKQVVYVEVEQVFDKDAGGWKDEDHYSYSDFFCSCGCYLGSDQGAGYVFYERCPKCGVELEKEYDKDVMLIEE